MDEWLAEGAIKPNQLEFRSPIVLMKKKKWYNDNLPRLPETQLTCR